MTDEDALVAVARQLQKQAADEYEVNGASLPWGWYEQTWDDFRAKAEPILLAQSAPLDAAAYEGVIRIINGVGQLVKQERTRLKMSQGAVAAMLGWNGQAQLSKIESGATAPSTPTVIALLTWLAEASELTPP